jgi:pimeloyl-ACP methyl ester carboxylesterase
MPASAANVVLRPAVARLRRAVFWLGLAGLGALLCAVTIEQIIEASDVARLSIGQTFLDVGKARIRYRVAGEDRPGPTVVLVNGFVAPFEQWDEVQRALAETSPTLAYDRAGLGLSRGSEARDAASQAEELVDVLAAARSKLPIVAVVYSSSSLTVRVLAKRHPELVEGLVFIDPKTPEQILDRAYLDRYVHDVPWPVRAISLGTWTYQTARMLVPIALGMVRFQTWRQNRSSPPASEHVQRLASFFDLTSTWRVGFDEARVLDRSARDALAWPGAKTDLPMGVMSSGEGSDWPYLSDEYQLNGKFAASSTNGTFLSVPGWSHEHMLEDPSYLPAIVEMIRSVVDQAKVRFARRSAQ